MIRQRARLVSTFARPLLWLIIIGSGFSALIPGGQFSYHKYLLPGIIGMVILFSSLLSALGSVHDREFGSMRMLLIAPVPRAVIVVAKAISSTLLGVAFAIVLSPLAWLFHIQVGLIDYLGFIVAAVLTAAALSSLGMLVAARVRQLENFAVTMNFVIFPMFFLSGALYPTTKLPGWLQPLVRVNPLTYGVDLMRHRLLANEPLSQSRIQFSAGFDTWFLIIFTVLALTLASLLFGSDEHLAPTLLAGGRRRASRAVRGARVRLPTAPRIRLRRPAFAGGNVSATGAALSGVIEREFKRAARQRGRLASTFVRPLLWLIAVGAGFSALIPGGHYQRYLLPGIIGMVILFSSMLSALGSVHDRQFGPMRMLLVAPVPRGVVVLGKTLSSALLALVFAIVFSPLAWIFGIDVGPVQYLGFLGAAALTALALSSLGMLGASLIRQLEDFAVAMNFVIFPMFFLSGALYPPSALPVWLQPIVRINPLTYGVDLMRHTILAGQSQIVSPAQFAAGWDAAFLAAFTVVAFTLATRFFGTDAHLAAIFLSGTRRRQPLASRRMRHPEPAPPDPTPAADSAPAPRDKTPVAVQTIAPDTRDP